jgi:uncharacterized protein YcaQ
MRRKDTFTFRVNETERQVIEQIADKLERSQSDAVRWLIRESARQMGLEKNDQTRTPRTLAND